MTVRHKKKVKVFVCHIMPSLDVARGAFGAYDSRQKVNVRAPQAEAGPESASEKTTTGQRQERERMAMVGRARSIVLCETSRRPLGATYLLRHKPVMCRTAARLHVARRLKMP